jgi:hypothetical protein
MAYSITLPARKNGRRIARDAAPGNGEFDIHTLAAWAQENLTPEEIGRVIAMLQDHLGKPAADDDPDGETAFKRERMNAAERALNEKLSGAQDSRRGIARPSAEAEFNRMFPDAARLKTSL